MSKAIWKFPVPCDDNVEILMPEGAQTLAFQAQDDVPQLWALVDPEATQVVRRFRLFGTGHPIDTSMEEEAYLAYIGTCQMRHGTLVWHLFEERSLKEGP